MDPRLANVLKQEQLTIRIWHEDSVYENGVLGKSAYIAECLDIPGCVSEGDTREEALANIHEAITLCLEVIQEECTQSLHGEMPSSTNTEVIREPLSRFVHS